MVKFNTLLGKNFSQAVIISRSEMAGGQPVAWIGAAVAIKLEGGRQVVATNRATLGLFGQAHDFVSPSLA